MSRFISLLLASSLFLAVLAVQPVSAGSQQAPEVTDAEHDITLLGPPTCIDPTPAPAAPICLPGCTIPSPSPAACLGDIIDQTGTEAGFGGDVTAAWVDHENGTAFLINIQTHGDPNAGLAADDADAGATIAAVRLTANFTVNGKTRSAVAQFTADGTSVGGVATAMSFNDTGLITTLVVPKAAFGNFTVGSSNMTGLFIVGRTLAIGKDVANPGAPSPAPDPFVDAPSGDTVVYDRAPDTGGGLEYNFTLAYATTPETPTTPTDPNLGGAPGCTYKSGETNRSDGDADCLPDYWEKQHFGGTAAQNGTGDPDGDGCNNRCEYLHGTDPNKKDTDGDGYNDGDEVKAGTDPTNKNSFPGALTPVTTTTTTPPATTTSTSSPPASSGTTSSSALDKIQNDAGYAVASAAAMGSIVLLSLIGLFGRWGA